MKIETPWRGFALALVAGALTACGGSDAEDPAAELTRAQKDSIIAEQPLPGARGVGKALEAAEAARERAQAHDTIH